MRNIRTALMAVSLILAGCNNVVTTTPAFRHRTGLSSVLKPGRWSYDKLCHGDDPATECGRAIPLFSATASDIRPVISPGMPVSDAKAMDHPWPYEIGFGDPLLVQIKVVDPSRTRPRFQYVYIAFEPTAYDEGRRVIEAKAWLVSCGPPPKKGDPNYGYMDEQGEETNHPFPGLHVDTGTVTCTPDNLAAIQNAAKASRLQIGEGDLIRLRWMGETH